MEQKELKKWLIDVILVIDDNKEEAKRMINYAIKDLETTKPVNVDLADVNGSSLPTITDMFNEATFNYPTKTKEKEKTAFMNGAKWCRKTTQELNKDGNR